MNRTINNIKHILEEKKLQSNKEIIKKIICVKRIQYMYEVDGYQHGIDLLVMSKFTTIFIYNQLNFFKLYFFL